jgi:hypothetical protein
MTAEREKNSSRKLTVCTRVASCNHKLQQEQLTNRAILAPSFTLDRDFKSGFQAKAFNLFQNLYQQVRSASAMDETSLTSLIGSSKKRPNPSNLKIAYLISN